ncbi:MAG: ABC transporter ATP-binding protein [Lachnospiraceae bacterium]|nr:ABC transporter ATP-binding protein [Lachnospiraceae bacterium]
MKNALIYTENLTVGYDGKPVVEKIELSLKKGEILTIIGPNGSGKSTILKSITRQLELLHGVVFLEDEPMKNLDTKKLAEKLSMVSTERISPELMTCEDVVETGRYPYTGSLGILSGEDHEKVREALEVVRAIELRDVLFNRISDGQRQRIMLARAICQEPELLVLDEPTSYLDIQHKLDFLNILKNMQKTKNLAVLMSLHELDLAQKVSDMVMCVTDGRIDRYGTVEEVFSTAYIQQLFRIEKGSYNAELGFVELEKPIGVPKVFVIGGAGSGVKVYRKLQKEEIPFYAGVLHENDKEYLVAKALATEVVSTDAFEPITDADFQKALGLLNSCDRVICTVKHFGTMNRKNEELLAHAKREGKLYTYFT